MPRGSNPGERRGGRQRGTPNKATVAKAAALAAASADPTLTPLQYLLGVMRDPAAPTGLRVQVARAAAPLVHGKSKIPSVEDRAGYAGAAEGFNIDIAEAKAFRDMEHRRAVLMRKRFGPSENRTLTAAEIVEESELGALINKRAAEFVCPPGYRPDDAMKDSNRLHQLDCRRMRPPACGGGELKGAEDEEEAFLTARVAAFWHSPEGRDRKRMRELEFKGIGRCRTLDEQKELDQLTLLYPETLRESELATAIKLKLAELRKKAGPVTSQ
jgi:hypothetical protein